MKNTERILADLDSLVKEGSQRLVDGQKKNTELWKLAPRYEQWYTRALAVVTQITPERLPEFKEAYRHDRRKAITYDTYTVSDFLIGLEITRNGRPTFNTTSAFAMKLLRQVGILAVCIPTKARTVSEGFRAAFRAKARTIPTEGAQDSG